MGRSSTKWATTAKTVVKSKVVKPKGATQSAPLKKSVKKKIVEKTVTETAYEHLTRKVEENRKNRKLQESQELAEDLDNAAQTKHGESVQASFEEDDTIMEIGLTGPQQMEFLSEDEDGMEEDTNDQYQNQGSVNNNSQIPQRLNVIQSSVSAPRATSLLLGQSCIDDRNSLSDGSNKQEEMLAERIELLQTYMVKKGLMELGMSNEDIRKSLEHGGSIIDKAVSVKKGRKGCQQED